MFAIFPLGKKGSTGIPIITIFICVVCAIVYAFANTERDQLALSYYPHSFDVLKMFTSSIAHGSLLHLVGNLFFFYCFARTIETQISIVGYLFAFVLFVFATNLAYDFSAKEPIPTLGLSGVVWGYMGIFLMRYPRERIDCFVWCFWIFKTIEVPALIFILAFLAFDVASYRHVEDTGVNYVAHFSGFACGVLFKLLFWKLFTTEQPEPKKKAPFVLRPAPPRQPRGGR
jgi:membrane associated rhomboid family serine protease